MSVDISVSITEDVVDIIATPTVNIVNVTNSASINPGLYDLSQFTNTSVNPFTRTNSFKTVEGASIIGTGDIDITKASVGLGNVDNTSDLNKPISTATQTALNAKVTGNTAITGATKTKVTYDSKGLVTAGADATTADIADSTNKRYVTDANLTVIGNTSGTNTGDQTLSGLGGVPTSRTLTINGTTQDLSADRTFTISTGITIGTTAITSGTVGRVLFEGTGNVVQESANLFWDNTNGRLGIGTSSPTQDISITKSSAAAGAVGMGIRNNTATAQSFLSVLNDLGEYGALEIFGSTWASSSQQRKATFTSSGNNGFGIILYNSTSTANFSISTTTTQTERFRLFGATGNVVLQNGGTFTDAGFKLDVNGTFRSSTGTSLINDCYFGDTLGPRIRVSGGAGLISCVYNTLGLSGGLAVSVGNNTFSIGTGGATNGTLTITTPAKVANTSETINLISSNMYYGVGEGRLVLQGASSVYSGSIGNLYLAGGRNSGGGNNGNTYLAYDLTGALGSVGIGTNSINASAITQIDSTTKGFLPPRMTTTQKNAIASPSAGLMVYDTTLNVISVYNGTTWITL